MATTAAIGEPSANPRSRIAADARAKFIDERLSNAQKPSPDIPKDDGPAQYELSLPA